MNEERERGCRVMTVGAFTAGIAKWFARRPELQYIGIEGEVSGLRDFGDGHLGFTLKDERASIECVAWASFRRAFPRLENGDKAIAYGGVRLHAERGGYKLYVESVELSGRGELLQLYERLREKFESEGLFDSERKREVPDLLHRIALVSPRDGKGTSDFMRTIRDEVPFVEVVVVETRVQGEGAEIDIATALDRAAKYRVEAIVLTRGGGKYEELFTFNLEPVVRAIVRSPIPVITAIGHEPDRHLADAVADRSFDTPSKAAEFIAKGWLVAQRRLSVGKRDLERAARDGILRRAQRTELTRGDLERALLRVISSKRAALTQRAALLERRNPQRALADARERLATRNGRLTASVARLVSQKAHVSSQARGKLEGVAAAWTARITRALERADAALDRCDPLAPLGRGYAIVTKNGQTLRNASAASVGDLIEARLERGRVGARVESVNDHA